MLSQGLNVSFADAEQALIAAQHRLVRTPRPNFYFDSKLQYDRLNALT